MDKLELFEIMQKRAEEESLRLRLVQNNTLMWIIYYILLLILTF